MRGEISMDLDKILQEEAGKALGAGLAGGKDGGIWGFQNVPAHFCAYCGEGISEMDRIFVTVCPKCGRPWKEKPKDS